MKPKNVTRWDIIALIKAQLQVLEKCKQASKAKRDIRYRTSRIFRLVMLVSVIDTYSKVVDKNYIKTKQL